MAIKKITYNGSSKVILRLCEAVNALIDAGGGGGSTVTYTQTLSSGTQTGSISIDGVSTNMYAPTPPSALSELSEDTTHRVVTDTEKSTWNGKVSKSGDTMSGLLSIDYADGTISDVGSSYIQIGNTTAKGSAGNSRGVLNIASKSQYLGQFFDHSENGLTAHRGYYLPDNSGTLALTSDIPTDNSQLTNGAGYITSSGSCAYATSAGSATDSTKVLKAGDTMSGHLIINRADGTVSAVGHSQITLGNNISEGTAENSYGRLALYGKGSNFVFLEALSLTADRAIELPDADGTVALTSDITKVNSGTLTESSGFTLIAGGLNKTGRVCDVSATFLGTVSTPNAWTKVATGSIKALNDLYITWYDGNNGTILCAGRYTTDGELYIRPTITFSNIYILTHFVFISNS